MRTHKIDKQSQRHKYKRRKIENLESGYKYFLLLKSLLFPYWKQNNIVAFGRTINNPGIPSNQQQTVQQLLMAHKHTQHKTRVEWRIVKAKTEITTRRRLESNAEWVLYYHITQEREGGRARTKYNETSMKERGNTKMMSPPIENKLQLDYIPVHKTFVSPMNFDTVAVVLFLFLLFWLLLCVCARNILWLLFLMRSRPIHGSLTETSIKNCVQ